MRRDQRGNAASSRHGGKTIPVVSLDGPGRNRKRGRERKEKGGEGGGSELQRAEEDAHSTHTLTLKETQRLDSIEISMLKSITRRNHSELKSTTI